MLNCCCISHIQQENLEGKWTGPYVVLFYSTSALKALYTTCVTHPIIETPHLCK